MVSFRERVYAATYYPWLVEGVEAHYRQMGVEVEALPWDSPEAVDRGIVRIDLGNMRVRDRSYQLLALRPGGFTPAGVWTVDRESSSRRAFQRGTHRIPVQYHHIVRKDPTLHRRFYRVKLRLQKKGIWKREVVDGVWRGGGLAATLRAHRALGRPLLEVLRGMDSLRVAPDARHRVIRVVFHRPLRYDHTAGSGAPPEWSGVNPDTLPPAEVLEAVETIASLIRRT